MSHNYGLILAGGRGTRFWPRSRRKHSKQVLNVVGERTLIQQTVDRLAPLLPPERLWVITNADLRREIIRQLPEIPPSQILAEPCARNTAPAIGLGAKILHSIDPDSVMGVYSADHVIAKPGLYRRYLRIAYREAARGTVVVLGNVPLWPETGYGYVEFPEGMQPGALSPVLAFHEKPDQATAERYLSTGRFYWNAGMFFWKTGVLLDLLARHLPKTAERLAALPRHTDRRFKTRLGEVFPECDKISIDYAVLEKAESVAGVPCQDIGWSDVGTWNAVYELARRDPAGNAARGDVLFLDSECNYVDGCGKLIALMGVRDLVVVETPDAILVADRRQAQRVGAVVDALESRGRRDLL
jgi:mannose-1-phosphate guanylyltransferase